MTLNQVRVSWTGLAGLPGVSTHYFQTMSASALTDLRAFYSAIAAAAPVGLVITVPGTGMTIDSVSGFVNGTWSAAVGAPVNGSVAGGYAAPVGGVCNWLTGAYASGRQIKGKTFMVPLAAACFDSDGTLKPTNLANLQAAANVLVTSSGQLTVYSRKLGAIAAVTTAKVADMAAVLTSRRN